MARLLFFYRNLNRFQRVSFLFLAFIWGGNSLVLAQQQASGVVISSENEEPVVGASIALSGYSIGTVSDLDGKFTLDNIPSGSNRLTVSFLGYRTQELLFKNGEYITVVLELEASLLDEVIITVPYGVVKKSAFTGSTGYVPGNHIERSQVSNISKALEGTVAGL
jgi:hypothetical protein